MVRNECVKRGDIYIIHLTGSGSEQNGTRPVVIIQNDVGNRYSPTTVVVPLTSQNKKEMPTHVDLCPEDGVVKPSTVLCEQPFAVDKSRLMKKLGELNTNKIEDINKKIMFNLGIGV